MIWPSHPKKTIHWCRDLLPRSFYFEQTLRSKQKLLSVLAILLCSFDNNMLMSFFMVYLLWKVHSTLVPGGPSSFCASWIGMQKGSKNQEGPANRHRSERNVGNRVLPNAKYAFTKGWTYTLNRSAIRLLYFFLKTTSLRVCLCSACLHHPPWSSTPLCLVTWVMVKQ